jgi:hypothetical protein
MRGRAALILVALLAAATPTLAEPGAGAPITSRSFTITAQAFPIAVVPGRGGVELGTRELATQLSIANAPAAAYARAALYDNGTIELYTGPPPAGAAAECDTTAGNQSLDARATPGASELVSSCRPAPAAVATASGALAGGDSGSARSASSAATGGADGDHLYATADAAIDDAVIGPLHLGSMRYHAEGRADGVPGGAAGTATVTAAGATVNGVPVTITSDGIGVDATQVPAELVETATKSVHDSLAQGGYADIRIVQPDVEIAPDGTTVRVQGGGVFADLATNDPSQPYFMRNTFVGGTLTLSVGGALDATATAPATAGAPPAGGSAPVATQPAASSASSGASAAVASRPTIVTRDVTYHEPVMRRVWLWIVLVGALGMAIIALERRRLDTLWQRVAERYLRG